MMIRRLRGFHGLPDRRDFGLWQPLLSRKERPAMHRTFAAIVLSLTLVLGAPAQRKPKARDSGASEWPAYGRDPGPGLKGRPITAEGNALGLEFGHFLYRTI
jgi:hypothetical protein